MCLSHDTPDTQTPYPQHSMADPADPGDTTSHPWVSNQTAQDILIYTQIAYPIVLLLFFITAFTVRSVLTARSNDNDTKNQSDQLGPGGKPLPKKSNQRKPSEEEINILGFSTPQRILFQTLQAGVLLSICGNIAVVIIHALAARQEHWWCGQAPTVSVNLASGRDAY